MECGRRCVFCLLVTVVSDKTVFQRGNVEKAAFTVCHREWQCEDSALMMTVGQLSRNRRVLSCWCVCIRAFQAVLVSHPSVTRSW